MFVNAPVFVFQRSNVGFSMYRLTMVRFLVPFYVAPSEPRKPSACFLFLGVLKAYSTCAKIIKWLEIQYALNIDNAFRAL